MHRDWQLAYSLSPFLKIGVILDMSNCSGRVFLYINSIKEFGKGGYQEFYSIYQNSSNPSEFLI